MLTSFSIDTAGLNKIFVSPKREWLQVKNFELQSPFHGLKKCHRIRGLSSAFMFCQWEGTEFVDSQAGRQPRLSLCVTCLSLCKQPSQTHAYQSFSITSPVAESKLLSSSLYFYELEKHEISLNCQCFVTVWDPRCLCLFLNQTEFKIRPIKHLSGWYDTSEFRSS